MTTPSDKSSLGFARTMGLFSGRNQKQQQEHELQMQKKEVSPMNVTTNVGSISQTAHQTSIPATSMTCNAFDELDPFSPDLTLTLKSKAEAPVKIATAESNEPDQSVESAHSMTNKH